MRSGDLKLLFGEYELLLDGEVMGRKLFFGDIELNVRSYYSIKLLLMYFAVFLAFFWLFMLPAILLLTLA